MATGAVFVSIAGGVSTDTAIIAQAESAIFARTTSRRSTTGAAAVSSGSAFTRGYDVAVTTGPRNGSIAAAHVDRPEDIHIARHANSHWCVQAIRQKSKRPLLGSRRPRKSISAVSRKVSSMVISEYSLQILSATMDSTTRVPSTTWA